MELAVRSKGGLASSRSFRGCVVGREGFEPSTLRNWNPTLLPLSYPTYEGRLVQRHNDEGKRL
jgi:hypothetical protein